MKAFSVSRRQVRGQGMTEYIIIVALIAVALIATLALQRMPVDIFPQVGDPAIYVAQPYGGMDPAQMEGLLTNYYEYHFLYISGIHHVESRNVQGTALMRIDRADASGKMVFEAEGLRKAYGPRVVVAGFSTRIMRGDRVGLIGANGAGKTTTMRILSTLDLPTAGTVFLGGINVVEQPNDVRRRLAWMPDHFTPYKDTTVLQYLDFFARAQDLHGEERTRRLAEIAAYFFRTHT